MTPMLGVERDSDEDLDLLRLHPAAQEGNEVAGATDVRAVLWTVGAVVGRPLADDANPGRELRSARHHRPRPSDVSARHISAHGRRFDFDIGHLSIEQPRLTRTWSRRVAPVGWATVVLPL